MTWTLEAIADPGRIVRNGQSRNRLSVQVVGRCLSVGRVLAVYLRPAHRPSRNTWFGATARVAAADERKQYQRHQP